ncbi:hypothetical protein BRADI_5g16775v3, partial [Brachypodium distachyon]
CCKVQFQTENSLQGKELGKVVASISLLVLWETWKERNRRMFQNKLRPKEGVLSIIKEEAAVWKQAGAGIGVLCSGPDDVP